MIKIEVSLNTNNLINNKAILTSSQVGKCKVNDYSENLLMSSGILSKDAIFQWHKLIEFYATHNESSDWWYYPVSEGQPNMSIVYDALETRIMLDDFLKKSVKGEYLLTVSNALIVEYLICNYKKKSTVKLHLSLKTKLNIFINNFKLIYQRYINGIIWLYYECKKIILNKKWNNNTIVNNVDILCISRFESDLYKIKHSKIWKDRYLGLLPQELSNSKQNVLVLGRAGIEYKTALKAINIDHGIPLRLIQQYISILDLIKILSRAYSLKLSVDKTEPLSRYLYKESRNHIRALADCLIVEYSVRKIITDNKVSKIICMQENCVWEHAVQNAVDRTGLIIQTYGYFHCPVIPSSLRYYTSEFVLSKRPLFDHIITLGKGMNEALSHLGPWKKKIIGQYSFRNPDLEMHLNDMPKLRSGNLVMLILLGGMYDNSKFLRWVVSASEKIKGLKLIIKGHPVFGSEKYIEAAGINLLPGILEDTKKELADILGEVDGVIYKGTTAALSAMAIGLPVIHIQHNTILTDDVLFNSKDTHVSVKNKNEFRIVIEKIMSSEIMSDIEYVSRAKDYVNNYYDLNDNSKKKVINLLST